MKKEKFLINKIKPTLWLGFHLLIVLLFFVNGKFSIDTNLYSTLPDTNPVKSLSEVDGILSSKLNSSLIVLLGHEDFYTAKEASFQFEKSLQKVKGIKNIQFTVDPNAISNLYNYLYKYRYQFLSPQIKDLLSKGEVQALSEKAFFNITSPVSFGFLDNLNMDPFLLANDNLQYVFQDALAGNMSLSVRDSVLYREHKEKSWIFLTVEIEDGSQINSDTNPVKEIYSASKNLEEDIDGLQFAFSGVPFHSYNSTIESKNEITLFSTISTFFIIFLILIVFRSFKPLIYTVITILLGMLTGFLAVLTIFQEIHIFTIVFGTSLIGISVDYSFHFFTDWAKNSKFLTNNKIIKQIIPGITVGLITTILSYGAFTISPFPLLQQISLFSISGLISTYISVTLLFPKISKSKCRTKIVSEKAGNIVYKIFSVNKKFPFIVKLMIMLFFITLLFFGLKNFTLDNNIKNLYEMSPTMFDWEKTTAEVLNHGSSGVYFIVEGNSLDENLEIEESIKTKLDYLKDNGSIKSYIGLSDFINSKSTQKSNYDLIKRNLLPFVKEQLYFFGYNDKDYNNWLADFKLAKKRNIETDDVEKLPAGNTLDKLNLGFVGNKYYTTILLFGIDNYDGLLQIDSTNNGIYLINKVKDTSKTLQDLSILVIKIIIISYFVIFILLLFRYGLKNTSKIVLIPLMASLITLSIVNLLGYPVNIFVVVGLILIPGMGTDYVILLTESKTDKKTSLLSITLSMMTTFLAFGLLGFTSIAGTFGITVSLGVIITYFLTSLFVGLAE